MKIVLALSLFFFVAGCGKNASAPLAGTLEAQLTSLSVKFEPATGAMLVSGLMTESTGTGETEFFYFTGTREPGAILKDPIEGTPLVINCEVSHCSSLNFVIKGKRLALAQSVRVMFFAVTAVRSEIDARDFSGDTFAEAWKELLRRGVEPLKSTVSIAGWGDKTFFGIYLAGASTSRTHWVHVSGANDAKKFSVNYSHQGKVGPIYTLGTEPGTIGSDGPTPFVIGLPGGRLFLSN